MPPPSLFGTTIVRSIPARAAPSSPPRSCSSARSPASRTTGSPVAAAVPGGRRHDAVDAVGAPMRHHPRRSTSGRQEGVQISHGHAVGGVENGAGLEGLAEQPRQSRLEQRLALQRRRDGLLRGRLGQAPGVGPGGRRPPRPERGQDAPGQRAERAAPASGGHRRGAPPNGPAGRRARCPRPRRPSPPAAPARRWGGRPARARRACGCSRTARCGPDADRLRRSRAPRSSPVRRPEAASAMSGQPASAAKRFTAPASAPERSDGSDRQHAPLPVVHEVGQLRHLAGVGCRQGRRPRRLRAGRGAARLPFEGLEGLAQRGVEVDRSAGRAERGGDRSMRREAGVVGSHLAGHGQVCRPAHVRAVQADLVDRLAGAAVAQLGWTIGGQHHQAHPVVERLGHRRQVVGGRTTRRADQGDAPAPGLGEAEGEEAAGSLVELHPAAQPRLGVCGQHQRCRARARRADHVAHAPVRQLLEERTEVLVRGHRSRTPPSGASSATAGTAFSFETVSRSSAAGSDPSTTPEPAKSAISLVSGSSRPERRAMQNSPLPDRSVHPTGPANQPRPPGSWRRRNSQRGGHRPARDRRGLGARCRRVPGWRRERWRSLPAPVCRGAGCRGGRARTARAGRDPARPRRRSCPRAGARPRCRARAAPCGWPASRRPERRPGWDPRRGDTIRPGRRPRRCRQRS